MKYEWRKKEKELYLPKAKPTIVEVPPLKYFTLSGEGNPNSENYAKMIEALYAASYTIRMSNKKGLEPDGFYEYTVYPLEGYWSLNEKGIDEYARTDVINKDHLKFKIMIRQPDFVSEDYANKVLEDMKVNKPNPFNHLLTFEEIEEGLSLQILHTGAYDDEPATFKLLDEYCIQNNYTRLSNNHKEIYLSDPRKTAPDKNKTVLRIAIQKNDTNSF